LPELEDFLFRIPERKVEPKKDSAVISRESTTLKETTSNSQVEQEPYKLETQLLEKSPSTTSESVVVEKPIDIFASMTEAPKAIQETPNISTDTIEEDEEEPAEFNKVSNEGKAAVKNANMARPYHYKFGKQKLAMSPTVFLESVKKAKLCTEHFAYICILWWIGCRKSELYERTADDVAIYEDCFTIDLHQRKKHGDTTPPIKIYNDMLGAPELLAVYSAALRRKPVRKTLQHYVRKTERGKDGKTLRDPNNPKLYANSVIIKTNEVRKDRFLFPRVGSSTAVRIIKQALGEKYYPHYLRLCRITTLGKDKNITRIRSVTGIRTVKAIEAYLGLSQEEADIAADQTRAESQKMQAAVPSQKLPDKTQQQSKSSNISVKKERQELVTKTEDEILSEEEAEEATEPIEDEDELKDPFLNTDSQKI